MDTPDASDFRWQAGATTLARVLPLARLEAGAVAMLREAAESSFAQLPGSSPAVHPVAIACSGGADSLATLLLVWAHFPELHGRFAVLHFNHHTRPECAQEARFVQRVAEALGETFYGAEIEGDRAALNEARLRESRLQFFQTTCAAHGVHILVQGHHAGDVVESVLMRLARGSGCAGLCAPRPVQRFAGNETAFVRPLLTLEKREITEALRVAGLPWCEDATNAGDSHLRNRIRHGVVPAWEAAAGTEVATGVLRSRRLIEEDDAALEAWAAALWAKMCDAREDENSGAVFDWTPISGIPAAVHRRVLHKALAVLGLAGGFSAPAVDAIVGTLVAGVAGQWSAGHSGALLVFDGRELRLRFADPAPEAPTHSGLLAPGLTLFWNGGALTAALEEISPALFARICAGHFSPAETAFLAFPKTVAPPATPPSSTSSYLLPLTSYFLHPRPRRSGDTYRPLGSPGHRKLSDIFIDKKIPEMERHRLPVVCDKHDNILWIPGLPPSEDCRLVRPGRCLRLTWQSATSNLPKEFSNEPAAK